MVSERIRHLISDTIEKFELDLSDLIVLTEIGTNYFALTPVIAASAGAKVFAVVPANPAQVSKAITDMARYGQVMDLSDDRIWLSPRSQIPWGQIDIITNVGNVRPIDKKAISKMSMMAVVSLMCEAWEVRPKDVNVPFLIEKGVPVLAVDENLLGIWPYCGSLALKMLLEKDIELHKSRILILGKDKFAVSAFQYMSKAAFNVEWMPSPPINWSINWRGIDAVVLSNWEGPARRENIPLGVEIVCLAERRRVTRTLAYLGPRPVIELYSAGLKIGELLARTVKRGLKGERAENSVLSECDFAQRWTHYDA